MNPPTAAHDPASHDTGPENAGERLDVTVVICAYTLDRWDLLERSVASVLAQKRPPCELLVCIDHNAELAERARASFSDPDAALPVRVLENRYGGRLGSARTTALEAASGELIAFLDDDAAAEPDWLERLVAPLGDPSVVAVGGAPHPDYGAPRPSWFPLQYDWVFGCIYQGLPTSAAPVRHLIGAAMAARRADLLAIGGFHSDNHDDMDMCHRLVAHTPGGSVLFEPAAVVNHHVPANRLTWSYFWRRCFLVNRGKAEAFHEMGEAGNLVAEREFARRLLTKGIMDELRQLTSGDLGAAGRLGALMAGLALAGAGYTVGTAEIRLRERRGATPLQSPGSQSPSS
ncbi:MAG: glycosyl transferase, family 2 [Acidimicrobiaceae bacterium]|nr:glycosyl transferase, family 2 [Acidimicrobiaceae bacterium]